jgi:ABC-type multidrug transport system ATPase subunit
VRAPVIEVSDLVKEFGRRRVIDGVSFTVLRGQVCALLGPTSGTIRVASDDVVTDRSVRVRGLLSRPAY